jgi:hypothetical protein
VLGSRWSMRDILVEATLILAFATLVTVHVFLSAKLALRSQPRWRGLVAIVLVPLAPVWALREGWRRPAAIWFGALGVYLVALFAALR